MSGFNMRIIGVLLLARLTASAPQADEVEISVQANQALGPVSRLLTGACIEDVNHEIYGGLYSQMIFGESFQEPAPSPRIAGFKTYGGRWIANSNALSINGLDGPKLVNEFGAFSDGAVGVCLKFTDRNGDNAGLIARVSKPGVGADKFIGYEISLDPARQSLRLARHRNNYELIKDVKCDVAVEEWISLEARFAGTKIEIVVDGKTALSHDDGANALPVGGAGLRAWRKEASFRDFWVKTGSQYEALPFVMLGESPEVSGQWRAVHRGAAEGSYICDSARPFVGAQSQRVSFDSGAGEWGIENQGLNRWGMNVFAGKPYEGYVWARAERTVTLFAALESGDGSQAYAETPLAVAGNGDWKRIDFSLTPNASDKGGSFALKLKQPGSVALGHAFLQPGEWGRFKGLPVRRDVAEALIAQGITVLRYGGSMVNNTGYKWKNMIGPRDRRPPYAGHWYRYSSNGWGIPDFMNFCEAAGFEYVPDFCMSETPQDMADFIEYAKGLAESEWGRKRVSDGHPQPYRLRYLQLGNEERVDEYYFTKFKPLAEAIWAKDPDIILIVGDFFYNTPITDPFRFDGGSVKTLAAHKQILDLAKAHNREVWFDIHINTEAPPAPGDLAGPRSFIDQLGKLSPGARCKVVIFEFNAGNHAQKRALSNALAVNALARDGRIPIACSANCLQPDGQNDNGWDQGLLFLNPSQVWLQPPGYVTQMFSRNYQPLLVKCEVTGAGGKLDANASRSDDGKTLVLQVVNSGDKLAPAQIRIAGFVLHQPQAQVTELSGFLSAVNTADKTDVIVPTQSAWTHGMKEGITSRIFLPHSFTVLCFK